MTDNSPITAEDFENLLRWLSDDRAEAGKLYEKVRAGLISFFGFRGCAENAEVLADETITRVARKVSTFDNTGNVKPITFFYGFAANIALEESRRRRTEGERLREYSLHQKRHVPAADEDDDGATQCLHECLAKLSEEDRKIFIEYYAFEKGKKAQVRKDIAARLGCEMNTLHVRVFRLRKTLKSCVKKCLIKNL